ncbi:hypothetical protein OF83DRAFT_1168464 [Amylostereum chailletii]|nr:hypothetical protein OF83DRAFT_1168464 [Amylostereum chailletii]
MMLATTPDAFNWDHQRSLSSGSSSPLEVKSEPATERPSRPSSPPVSTFLPKSVPSSSSSSSLLQRRASSTSTGSQSRRVKPPYPIPARDLRTHERRGEDATRMAHPGYNQWIKSENEVDRHQAFAIAQGAQPGVRRSFMGEDARPGSSRSSMTSSSLRGAMGDIQLSSNSEYSGSPSPTSDAPLQRSGSYSMPSGMVWTQTNPDVPEHQATLPPSGFDNVAHHHQPSSIPYTMSSSPSSHPSSASSGSYIQYPEYATPNPNFPSSSTPHPASQSSPIFTSAHYQNQQYYSQQPQPQPHPHSRSQSSLGGPGMITHSDNYTGSRGPIPISPTPIPPATRPPRSSDDELRMLRNKVRELELINESARLRIRELESELATPVQGNPPSFQSSSGGGGMSSSFISQPTVSPSFSASWRARTDARIKLFCSLNRAGNALCAWHDSRRERRAHPPRMAPEGHLNCGCTFEEALFEESLARHGVGSYHPGENVRMDPALRNPLLKVLQERYGYRDGDFERDGTTGNWRDGEGHAYWEAKALAGSSSHRKHRADERR